MRKNCTNQYDILKIDTFSGGGGNAILWTNRLYGHLGVSELKLVRWGGALPCEGVGAKNLVRPSKPGKTHFITGISRESLRDIPEIEGSQKVCVRSWPQQLGVVPSPLPGEMVSNPSAQS